ncbi:MAG: LacI family transcriptional regulator [Oscillospiraceae bacterium]|nr:LacI family transcriptional regulator [Oscillospiraceae bacterium]MDD3260357.1 LacI family DNA-binding transcriptional regulator [Oscillospiraceae bacterium]
MKRAARLKDIAEGLHVSITTVSKALNNHPDISPQRKKQILDYANGIGYVPNQVAKSFRQRKTKLIGIVLGDNANPFNARMIRGIEETFAAVGYRCVLMNSHEDAEREKMLINELRGLNVAGVLLTPVSGDRSGCDLLRQYDIPYVLVKRYIEKDQDTYVVIDDYKAAYLSAEYLCGYGNEKIYFLNFLEKTSSARLRLAGYQQALQDNGVRYDPACVVSGCVNQADGYEAMKQILEENKPPFSVMCYSDYIAIGAICAIQERGYSLPYDVALIGNDDIEILSFVKPRLTTIGVPKLRLGARSAELLYGMITEKEKAERGGVEPHYTCAREFVKPSLIIRETS